MNLKINIRLLSLFICLLSFINSNAQVEIVNNDTSICEGETIILHANTNGRIPIIIPLGVGDDDVHADDPVPIGFPFSFYGNVYTQCVVSANGFITFDLSMAGAYSSYVLDDPSDVVPGNINVLNSIMPAYSDIDPSVPGGSIDYATQGTAPNRRFIVSFCNSGLFSCNALKASFQLILYETTNIIEFHLISQPAGACPGWNFGRAIQGVQNADGTLGVTTPGRNYPEVWTAYNDSRRYTPNGPNDYVVTTIPHAPVPDSSATITWYSGGFAVGTGHDFPFSYITTQTLVAMVTQCQDTTTDTVTVVVNQVYNITSVDSTNPSQCEAADGTISLFGFFPGEVYTVHYTDPFGTPVTVPGVVADGGGVLLITGLVEGNYTNFYVVSAEGCTGNTYPSIPLYDPPVVIDQALAQAPSFCEAQDGGVRLTGLVAGVTYSVTYTFNGTVYTISLTADVNGDVLIPNLVAGTYSNITATTLNCTSNMVGPVTLIDPLPAIGNVTGTAPSLCRGSDAFLTIAGLLPDSNYIVRYSLNTVPFQVPLVADGAGEIIVPNLTAGVYNQISVQLLSCESAKVGPVTIVNPPVTADFSHIVEPGCTEDLVRFTDLSTGSAFPFEYTWLFGDDSTSTDQHPVHTYFDQDTYTVTLMITDSICKDTVMHDVVIDHPLSASFTVDEDTICQGTAVNFTDGSTATPPVSYYWDFGNGELNSAGGAAVSSVYPYAGNYIATLVISDFIGCKDTAYKYIRVDSLTEINLSFADSSICAGEKVYIAATYADSGSTGMLWDFGDGIIATTFGHDNSHSYEYPGIYTVKVTATARVCADVEKALDVLVQPQPVITLGPDTAMCPTSAPIILNDLINGSNPSARWKWLQGDRIIDGANSFMLTATSPATYTSVVTIGECSATDSIWVREDCYIDVPNAFTPDGDGIADYFFPRQWLSRGVTGFKMLIFNRWGNEIFSTTNINGRGWDGKFNGEDQPQGVYVYLIEATFKDGTAEKKQGNVTLLR